MAATAPLTRPAPVPAALRAGILASLQPWLTAMNAALALPAYTTVTNAWGYSTQAVNPARSQAIAKAMGGGSGFFGSKGLLPSWYTAAAPYPNLSQGATPATGYVPLKHFSFMGFSFYSCPAIYGLNEGTQRVTPSIAAGANGWQMPGFSFPPTSVQGGQQYLGDWIFMGDPRPWLNIGAVGSGYTPGVSGKSITLQAATGIAIALSPLAVAAGVAVLAGAGAAEGAGVGAAEGIGTGVGEATGATAASAIPIAGNTAGSIIGAETVVETSGVLAGAGTAAGTVGGATTTAAVATPTLAATTGGGLSLASLATPLAGTAITTGLKSLLGGIMPKPKTAQPVGGSGYGGSQPEGGSGFNYMWLLLIPLLLLIVLFFLGRRAQG